MKVHPYLNFENKTEEAFRFYEKALGGKLTEFYRFGAMPAQEGFEPSPDVPAKFRYKSSFKRRRMATSDVG